MSSLFHFVARTSRLDALLPRSLRLCSLQSLLGDLEEGSLPLCFFGACEVCGVSCVFTFCFSSFAFLSVSKNAGSFFLLEVILGAGSVREGAGPSVRVHSIRWVSTAVVFMKNWSVSMVLEATSWRSASVFSSFSL